MILVLDASLTLAFLMDEPDSGWYPGKLEGLLIGAEVIAPAIWGPEVVNGLLLACRRGRFSQAEIPVIMGRLAGIPVALDQAVWEPEGLFALSQEHRLTAYDASYLDLALRRGAALATLDAALKLAAWRAGVPLIE